MMIDNNDISILHMTMNDSILDLFQNLRLQKTNQFKANIETLLIKSFNNNSQLSRELTLSYLYCIKSDSFINEMTNETLDKLILSKLRKVTLKALLDVDKVHLIHILLCFIEFYMVNASTAPFSKKIFTNFEVDKIDKIISKTDIEIQLAKLHIKSLIGLTFSLPFSYKFTCKAKGEEYLVNVLIQHIEKILLCRNFFYREYCASQLLKLFINSKSYPNVNSGLVKDYIRHCLTNKTQSNVLKGMLMAARTCYYQSILVVNWYETLIVNKNETEPYAFAILKENAEDLNQRPFFFGKFRKDMSDLVQMLFCDSLNDFAALNHCLSPLDLFISELTPSFSQLNTNVKVEDHLLHSYLLAVVFFSQFIGESEKLSQIDMNKAHYPNKEVFVLKDQLKKIKELFSKSRSMFIQKFFLSHSIPQESIIEEIRTVIDINALLCLLILINRIDTHWIYFEQTKADIKEANAFIVEQCFNEMVLHRYFNIICFSYVLETHSLYTAMPDKPDYYAQANMTLFEFCNIYINHEMYKLMFMMKSNNSAKDLIEFVYKQYEVLMTTVFSSSFKDCKVKLNYLQFNLELMTHLISGSAGAFPLMYCSSCHFKLGNSGVRLTKYLFECANCHQLNLMMVLDEEYMAKQVRAEAIQHEIVYPSLKVFAGKLARTLKMLKHLTGHMKYKVIALVMQFILLNSRYSRVIMPQEIREKLLRIQELPFNSNKLAKMKCFKKKKKVIKWYNQCQDFNIN